MKFKKIIGLSIFAASAVSFVTCANQGNARDILDNNDIVYEDDSPNPTANDGYCLITFDANGGTFEDGSNVAYFQARKGHNWDRIKDKLTKIPFEDDDWGTKPTDKEFKSWQTRDNKVIFDEYVFNEDNVTLTAKWGEPYEPKKFSTDSWDQVIQAANQGLAKLEEEYKFEGTTYTNDTFIISDPNNEEEVMDKTRYVNIEGLINPLYGAEGHTEIKNPCDWPVHVIGMSHDLIKDSPKTTAALTFEFTYAPIPAVGWDSSSEAGHQSWKESDLKNTLNSYFYFQFEDELQSGIQTVRKNTDDGTNQDNVLTLDEKIFIPSVSEVADPTTLNRIGVPVSYYENTRYQYYNQASSLPQSAYLIKTNPFVLDEGKPSPTTSWLRSPYLFLDDTAYDKSRAMIIKNDATASQLIGDEAVNVAHSVCPCFAIGENPECAVIANVGDGLTFETKEGFAKVGSDYESRIKVNDTFGGYRVPANLDGKIKVTVNGTTRDLIKDEDYIYDSAQGTLTIKGKVIVEGTSMILIDLIPDMDKFQAAPWEEVVEKADEGIDAFKEYYGFGADDNLSGLQKYLTIDGIKYRTRILDETYDPLSDGSGTATLTFGFVDAIGNPDVYDDETKANTNFPESQLNFRLSSFAHDRMPIELAEVKKPITVKTNDTWNLTYYDAKLFPLSMGETGEVGSEVDIPERQDDTGYNYYQWFEKDHVHKHYLPGTDNSASVWMRTPNANNYNVALPGNYNIKLNDEGRFQYNCNSTDNNYVAPAFCIGHSYESADVTFSGATDYFTVNDMAPETITAPIGQPLTIEKIAAKSLRGSIPEISEDNILITNGKKLFEDWDLVSYGGNDYDIVINKMPAGGVKVNIAFPSECVTFKLDDESPVATDVSIIKGENAPDTSLAYSTDGINFSPYTYGDTIPLSDLDDRVCFKAADGANNTRFADVSDFSEVPSTDYITKFSLTPQNPDGYPLIDIEGNIMTLLGDGETIPTTIDANSAFTGMFMNVRYLYDANGLMFTATGTSNDTYEAKGTYAYMFYNDNIYPNWSDLCVSPIKITGFNNYGEGKVSDTYRSMFYGNYISYMPYCDFSRTCPYMCESMFRSCFRLEDLNNVTTSKFNYDYSDHCFANMFMGSTHNVYCAPDEIDVPDEIGSSNVDAAESCCESMFDDTYITRAPNMMCNRPEASAFASCFHMATYLLKASITVKEISAGSKPYARFLSDVNVYGNRLEHLYIYGLENLTIWPGTDFENWLYRRGGTGVQNPSVLHANANVIAALEAYGQSDSSIPVGDAWRTEVL